MLIIKKVVSFTVVVCVLSLLSVVGSASAEDLDVGELKIDKMSLGFHKKKEDSGRVRVYGSIAGSSGMNLEGFATAPVLEFKIVDDQDGTEIMNQFFSWDDSCKHYDLLSKCKKSIKLPSKGKIMVEVRKAQDVTTFTLLGSKVDLAFMDKDVADLKVSICEKSSADSTASVCNYAFIQVAKSKENKTTVQYRN